MATNIRWFTVAGWVRLCIQTRPTLATVNNVSLLVNMCSDGQIATEGIPHLTWVQPVVDAWGACKRKEKFVLRFHLVFWHVYKSRFLSQGYLTVSSSCPMSLFSEYLVTLLETTPSRARSVTTAASFPILFIAYATVYIDQRYWWPPSPAVVCLPWCREICGENLPCARRGRSWHILRCRSSSITAFGVQAYI